MERKCPLCGLSYNAPPALSRTDNKTLICPSCGMKQALDAVGVKPDVQTEIIRMAGRGHPE